MFPYGKLGIILDSGVAVGIMRGVAAPPKHVAYRQDCCTHSAYRQICSIQIVLVNIGTRGKPSFSANLV